jgi:hypothetical protein
METISTKIKKSGKELGDHGVQFLTDTKVAGKSFVSFVQSEAKDWGEYLRQRYQHIEDQSRDLLKPENSPRDTIWVHLDSLIDKVTRRAQPTEDENSEEPAEAASASTEEIAETATSEASTTEESAREDDIEETEEDSTELA